MPAANAPRPPQQQQSRHVQHLRCFYRLLFRGFIRDAVAIAVVTAWCALQQVLLWMDRGDTAAVGSDRPPLLVVGLQGSRAPMLHAQLVAQGGGTTTAMTCQDLGAPSRAGKALLRAAVLKFLVQRILGWLGCVMLPDEFVQEQWLLGNDHVLLMVAPHLVCVKTDDLLTFQVRPEDAAAMAHFISAALRTPRVSQYVGQPLDLLMHVNACGRGTAALNNRQLSNAKVILCRPPPEELHECFARYMAACYMTRYHQHPELFPQLVAVVHSQYWLPAVSHMEHIVEVCSSQPQPNMVVVQPTANQDWPSLIRQIHKDLGVQPMEQLAAVRQCTPLSEHYLPDNLRQCVLQQLATAAIAKPAQSAQSAVSTGPRWYNVLACIVRPQYHANLMFIFVGWFIAGGPLHASAMRHLLLILLTFSTFYTGIYCMNSFAEYEADKRTKPWRSMYVSRPVYGMTAVTCMTIGLAAAFALQHSLVQYLLVFLGINVVYSTLQSQSLWALLFISLTSTVRMAMGYHFGQAHPDATLPRIDNPAVVFAATFLFILAIHVGRKQHPSVGFIALLQAVCSTSYIAAYGLDTLATLGLLGLFVFTIPALLGETNQLWW